MLRGGFINARDLVEPSDPRGSVEYRRDGGYIDNIHGTHTYPTSGIVHDNAEFVEDDFRNDRRGLRRPRLLLGIDLNGSWTIRPTVMGQVTNTNGSFAQERSTAVTDELQTVQYNPEYSNDKWIQAALTIEGKLRQLGSGRRGRSPAAATTRSRRTIRTPLTSVTPSMATAPISTA